MMQERGGLNMVDAVNDNVMLLSELLSGLCVYHLRVDPEIHGMCMHSKRVVPGDVFIACTGMRFDATAYIDQAIEAGAVAVLVDAARTDMPVPQSRVKCFESKRIPVVYLVGLRDKVGSLSSKFYSHPSRQLNVLGVTGTNGKTTVCFLLAHALSVIKHTKTCGVIGTLGVGYPNQLVMSEGVTTPDPILLQSHMAQFRDQHANSVVMEVSSHALDQNRVGGVVFDTAILTQVMEDHIDSYHGSKAAYVGAKKKLFFIEKLRTAVVNLDDEVGYELAQKLVSDKVVYGYSLRPHVVEGVIHIQCVECITSIHGLQLTLHVPPSDSIVIHSPMMGRFNAYNVLAVFTALLSMGIEPKQAAQALSQPVVIPGRMEQYGGGDQPLVIVDYAHTPDALEVVLGCLKEHARGKIWCVLGCGGERDRNKRSRMAAVAERLSERLILTDDNPRSEDPEQIIEDMVAGLLCSWAVEIEHNRALAIANAISQADKGDVVLIAGKGHEQYQIIGSKKVSFSDAEQVKQQLSIVRAYLED